MISALFARLRVPPRLWMLYSVVYFIWGTINNQIGQWLEIARFRYGFQVFTCYVLYLVPWSLLVRKETRFQQYLYGLLALAPLEVLGYSFGTSIPYPGNVIDCIFSDRNFTLVMTVVFAGILPLGNWIIEQLQGSTMSDPCQRDGKRNDETDLG